MGDIADYTLELMEMPDDDGGSDYFGNVMYDEETNSFIGPYSPRYSKRCRTCGSKYLHWRKTDRGWRLFEHSGEEHSCRRRRKQ